MTIKRGEEWGRARTAPADVVALTSDAEIARRGHLAPFSVRAGDLWQALGRPGPLKPGTPCTEVGIDALVVVVVRADDRPEEVLAASSVEVGRWCGPGGYTAVINAGFIGNLNLTPRSHPNDGRFEVFTLAAGAPLMQRVLIRGRARSGSHLPHPDVAVTSMNTFSVNSTSRRTRLRIDGVDQGRWVSLTVTCDPDHWRLLL